MAKKKKEQEPTWGQPGAVAWAIAQAGGDVMAGLLLYRLKRYFDPLKPIKRLERHGLEWIAMSRKHWASEAGLTEAVMKNRALPRLRKRDFVKIKQMKLSPNGPKLLWMHLDLVKLYEATPPPDLIDFVLNPKGIGIVKEPTYPYDKASIKKLEMCDP